MKFEAVNAYAFGPFLDATLQLAQGMNVVYGPNEAGKSTWHAALYAGLCGMRRGRGQPRREDRDFEERHRPWDGEGAWSVGAVVTLEDGRRVELRHDLAGRVESSARDFDVGSRDYSNEIMYEGAPDGSRWLGLDRRSFLSTACVRQAQMLEVLGDADSLQEELQRAAATAGTDATAAQGLELLRDYHATHVGTERAWTRPLKTLSDEVAAARRTLDDAREAHEEYLEWRLQVEHLEQRVRTFERQADAASAALAEREASLAEERLSRAQELSARFHNGPPRRPSDEDHLALQVATALETWRSRPDLVAPTGTTIPDLELRLSDLDVQLTEATATPSDEPLPQRRSKALALLGAGGAAIGVGLAVAGEVVSGALLLVIALGLLGWWTFSRVTLTHTVEADASAALRERRLHIEHLIDDRQDEEAAYAAALQQHRLAEEAIRQAAVALGFETSGPETQVEALRAWQQRREELMTEADSERGDWDLLQQLLGGQSLEEFTEETTRLRTHAETLAGRLDAKVMPIGLNQGVTDEQSMEFREEAREARDEWNTGRGELAQFAQNLPSVSEAEEALAAADHRLRRVIQLDRTLRTTIEFLEQAEDRVHRDLAPVLRATVLEWLPGVTGGRYTDCRVDPESLTVEVNERGGRWRRAELLSHGTAEQLYLLLRLALARHLSVQGEACPLILDDVLAACDTERQREVLETLHAISESAQVILFTHEEGVAAWAREELSMPRDRFTELDLTTLPA
ncbi:MAG: AAA family ATPase [Acidimicrobiia bacterium]